MEMPIPDDWDGVSTCRWAICWPDSIKWRGILYGLIEQPSQGRFWDAGTGSIIGVQNAFKPIYQANFNLAEVFMACNDQNIADALQAIASAVITASLNASASANASANGCCEQTIIDQNGGIQGSFIDPGTGGPLPIYGTQPPLSIPPGEFPAGYADLAEYELDKCQMANLVTDGIIESLRGLGALGVFNYLALAGLIVLAVTGAIIFPPAAIPIMAAALGFLAVEVTLLALAADEIEANRTAWVCAFYDSDSVQSALAVVSDLIDDIVDSIGTTGPKAYVIKQIILLLTNSDTVNQLFEKTAHLVYPAADCSACIACIPELTLVAGSGSVAPDETERTLTSVELSPGNHYIRIQQDNAECCDYYFEIVSLTSDPVYEIALKNCAGDVVNAANDPVIATPGGALISGDTGGFNGLISLGNDAAFTVNVIIASSDYVP